MGKRPFTAPVDGDEETGKGFFAPIDMEEDNTRKAFNAPVWGEPDDWEKKDYSNKIALIDADRYKYLVAHSIFRQMEHDGPDLRTYENLCRITDIYLEDNIFSQFKCKAYVFCFSAPSKKVFRYGLSQTREYKGNRAKKSDPYFYEGKFEDMANVFSYIESKYPTLIFEDLEADDILCMLQDDSTFIFSNDKDLKQVIGDHYDFDKRDIVKVDPDSAFRHVLGQCLTGDTVDGIPGIKGFGPVSLEKLMEKHSQNSNDELLMDVLKVFIDRHGYLHGVDAFNEMWNLVCMRQNRGEWLREKYSNGFKLIEVLKKS